MKIPRGIVCGFVSEECISLRSAPTLKKCFSLIHEKLLVRLSVLPMRTELRKPSEPVLVNPAGVKRAMPEVSGYAARLPFGIPSSLFLLIPKSSATWLVSYLL